MIGSAGGRGVARPKVGGPGPAAALAVALAAAVLASAGCARDATPTDYAAELTAIRAEMAGLAGEAAEPTAVRTAGFPAGAPVAGGPAGPQSGPQSVPMTAAGRATRHAMLALRYASLTSDFADFRAAEEAIDGALERVGPWPDLWYLKASFDFKLHRLARVEEDLAHVPELSAVPEIAALRADLALQEGRYDDARRGYETVLGGARTWDHLARLAYLDAKTGSSDAADALYAEAEELITAKEMRSYAWVELQRGLVDLDAERWDEALAHYRRADRAYSGYWLIEEHIAEVLGRLGETGQATARYRDLVERTNNPEFTGALAAIVGRRDPAAAADLYERAEEQFAERYRLYPEAALGHYLQLLLARPDSGGGSGPDLREMAERNHRLRPNGEAKTLLARAYLKLGEPDRARTVVDEILASPWRTAEVERLARQVGAEFESAVPQRDAT